MKKSLIGIVVISLFFSIFPLIIGAESDVIKNDQSGIPDKYLYQAILQELGKKPNKTFTKEEAAQIESLGADSNHDAKDIKTLKGIEHLTSLKSLYLCGHKITSLSEIGKLTQLKSLDISTNQISDLSPIRNLINLELFSISANKVTDFTPIIGLENLRDINLSYNNIRDFSLLKNMKNLQFIYIHNNPAVNFKFIESMTYLEGMSIGGENYLKKLPYLKKHIYLDFRYTFFTYNNIKKSEFRKKLPPHLYQDKIWLNYQLKLQNVMKTIKFRKPKSIRKIRSSTKKIIGKTHKGAMIYLRRKNFKLIEKAKADKKTGRFVLRRLNLKRLKGKTLLLISQINYVYGDDSSIDLCNVTFKLKK